MTALHLARPEDAERLLALIAADRAERGLAPDPQGIAAALTPLLEGSPHGVAYLIGPQRAPIGHIVIGFGWSVDAGGLVGTVDQLFIRPGVRGRGIGQEVLSALPKALAAAGLTALTGEVAQDDTRTRAFLARARFQDRPGRLLMTLPL
ncbi:GNAT family N-acetyltransferase [Thalassobius vesicularis]|uniref:GNAT family N-acetyltransferase n=1 Tax=Thalassobius vesicularis TaxID=1294297 RepID=A0A4V6RRW3_9RHOB|nr:GNAT family N-acetyltransferase [Thalassobius vesicularis]THD73464.1 GNAT family N-acetyltransferase [Thalassobius vesicularis]